MLLACLEELPMFMTCEFSSIKSMLQKNLGNNDNLGLILYFFSIET